MKKYEKNGFDPLHFSMYRKSKRFKEKPMPPRPPSVRGPADCRLKRSGENVFPLGELTFPLGEIMFPLAEANFPPGVTMFLLAETYFPLGEIMFPLAETNFLLGEIMFPLAEITFPLSKSMVPLAETKFPAGELTMFLTDIEFVTIRNFKFARKTRTKNLQWVKSKITIFAQEKKRPRVQFLKPLPVSHDKESHPKPPPPIKF